MLEDAIDHYTDAINTGVADKKPVSVFHANRAAVHLVLGTSLTVPSILLTFSFS